MIYLDHAATTPLEEPVFAAMFPYLRYNFGNPGSLHTYGRAAKQAVDAAREYVAAFFHTTPEHIIFTSGGSEASSLAFAQIGGIRSPGSPGSPRAVITSLAEHDSVIRAAIAARADKRYDLISFIAPGSDGAVTLGGFLDAVERIGHDPVFVSLMYVNNEIGSVSDIPAIAAYCHEHGITLHVDCVQAAGFLDLDSSAIPFDYASVSAHKIGGPKGIGCLYRRDTGPLTPIVYGGGQEFGVRGGTENVPAIVGFGTACRCAFENLSERANTASKRMLGFYETLVRMMDGYQIGDILHVNGAPPDKSPGKILSLRFDGLDAESLLLMLDANGVCCSAGSACHAHEHKPSRVLTALGYPDDQVMSSVRFSFSHTNTEQEVVEAAQTTARCAWMLSGHSGLFANQSPCA